MLRPALCAQSESLVPTRHARVGRNQIHFVACAPSPNRRQCVIRAAVLERSVSGQGPGDDALRPEQDLRMRSLVPTVRPQGNTSMIYEPHWA